MSKSFRTEDEANAELAEALHRYEERRPGLGGRFLAAVDRALDLISRFPQAGSLVPQVPSRLGVRRVPVPKFPFHVIYLETPEAIRILAFAHDSRRPGFWRSRLAKP